MAAATEGASIECGFCMRRDGEMDDPRVLPCSHVHCLQCLVSHLATTSISQCPLSFCRHVCDVSMENLPKYVKGQQEKIHLCDLCSKKGNSQPAVIYCPSCTKMFCTKHQEWHSEGHDDHAPVSISTYKAEATKLAVRSCSQHTGLPYSLACRDCLKVACVDCLSDVDSCTAGVPHQYIALSNLGPALKKKISGLSDELKLKEDSLNKLYKRTAKRISEFDEETEQMVQTIHSTRNAQVTAIKDSYANLEAELLQQRSDAKHIMGEFLESDIGSRCSDLKNQRLAVETKMKQTHEVDLVRDYEETSTNLHSLIDEPLPIFELPNTPALNAEGEVRRVELEIAQGDGIFIAADEVAQPVNMNPSLMKLRTENNQLPITAQSANNQAPPVDKLKPNIKGQKKSKWKTTPDTRPSLFEAVGNNQSPTLAWSSQSVQQERSVPLPCSLELMASASLNHRGTSVCCHGDSTYVGLWNKTLAIVDKNCTLLPTILTFPSMIQDVVVRNGFIYTLVVGNPSRVYVHDMEQRQIHQWTHTKSFMFNKMCVIGDEVVIPSMFQARLFVYSLNGMPPKTVPCPQLRGSSVAICAIDNNRVIVSDNDSSQVFCINIRTGQVNWVCKKIKLPQCIAVYRKYLLVTQQFQRQHKIVDIATGQVLSEISGQGIQGEIVGLDFSDKGVLAAVNATNKKILFFKLKF